MGKTGDVCAGMREARNKTGDDWIDDFPEDDSVACDSGEGVQEQLG